MDIFFSAFEELYIQGWNPGRKGKLKERISTVQDRVGRWLRKKKLPLKKEFCRIDTMRRVEKGELFYRPQTSIMLVSFTNSPLDWSDVSTKFSELSSLYNNRHTF